MDIYLNGLENIVRALLLKNKYFPQKEHFSIAFAKPIQNSTKTVRAEIVGEIDTEKYGVINMTEFVKIPKMLSLAAIKSAIKLEYCLVFIHTHVSYNFLPIDNQKYWSKYVTFSDADIKFNNAIVKVYNQMLYGNTFYPLFFIVINEYTYQAILWTESSYHSVELDGITLKQHFYK